MKATEKLIVKAAKPKGVFPSPNPKSRPNHKEEVLALKVQAELNKKRPEPMSLMHKREKNGSNLPDTLKGTATRGQIDNAAKVMATWDSSDPFSYGRTALHVSQGYIRSEEVVKEMTQRTLARQAAKRQEVDNAKSNLS